MAYRKVSLSDLPKNVHLLIILKTAKRAIRCTGDGRRHAADCAGVIRNRIDYVEWQISPVGKNSDQRESKTAGHGRACFPCAEAFFGLETGEKEVTYGR